MGDMFCEIYPQSAAHITKFHEYSTIFQLFIYLINYYVIKSPIPDPRSPILAWFSSKSGFQLVNYSSSPKDEWAIDSEAIRARWIIVFVKSS